MWLCTAAISGQGSALQVSPNANNNQFKYVKIIRLLLCLQCMFWPQYAAKMNAVHNLLFGEANADLSDVCCITRSLFFKWATSSTWNKTEKQWLYYGDCCLYFLVSNTPTVWCYNMQAACCHCVCCHCCFIRIIAWTVRAPPGWKQLEI